MSSSSTVGVSGRITLVLGTASYPTVTALEAPFIEPELEVLAKHFEPIILVPQLAHGEAGQVVPTIEIENALATRLAHLGSRVRQLAQAMLTPGFLPYAPRLALEHRSHRLLRAVAYYLRRGQRIRHWLVRWFADRRLDPARTLVYTYWCDEFALGAVLASRDIPGLRVVSRAHGYDLYEERQQPPINPFRDQVLAGLTRLFTVSQNGADYMARRYPWFAPRVEVARLGVADPGFRAHGSSDGVTRVVSCSLLIPLKRVDLVLEAMCRLATLQSTRQFVWTHFGDGRGMTALRERAQSAPSNLRVDLRGRVANHAVFEHYRTAAVDVFVNASTTEGVPVSIMEAEACGIPIVATAVGGTPEIVSAHNGALLPRALAPIDLAVVLERLVGDEQGLRARGEESRRVWGRLANAPANHEAFAERLLEIAHERAVPLPARAVELEVSHPN